MELDRLVVAEKQQKNSKRGAHLKPHRWPKGYCPNPGGRPKGRTLLSVIKEKLSTPDGDESRLEATAEAYIVAMESGSFQHLKEFIEREEGKLPDDATVRVIIDYVDPRDPADDETAAQRAAASN